jgi:hypothetical protein
LSVSNITWWDFAKAGNPAARNVPTVLSWCYLLIFSLQQQVLTSHLDAGTGALYLTVNERWLLRRAIAAQRTVSADLFLIATSRIG